MVFFVKQLCLMGMIPDAHDKNTPKRRKKLEPGEHYARMPMMVGRGGPLEF